jgi:C4-dicarboxylate-specific signal transduction histidine kinase
VPALLSTAVALISLAAIASGFNLVRMKESFGWVEHTNEVLRTIGGVERALLQAESEERGFVLTGDNSYLDNYNRAQVQTIVQLDALRQLTSDNPSQTQRIDALRPKVDARMEEFKRVIALGPTRPNEVLALMQTARAWQLTPQIEEGLAQMRQSELSLLDQRRRTANHVALLTTFFAVVTGILALASAAIGAFLWQRQRSMSELQERERRLHELQSELLHLSRIGSMGEMASALAHELNQPISAVTNYVRGSKRIVENISDERAAVLREALDKAAEQALRAGQVVKRLREFMTYGETERRVESIKKIVEEACALALMVAKEQSVRVSYALDPAVDSVLVDKIQIQQVLLNLVRNAIEAMQSCERRELVISTMPAPDDMTAITVADTGPGIDPHVMAKLFQPFVSTKARGMGVGLSISRTIIESHGGRITCELDPNGGTIFRLTLRGATKADTDFE